MEHVVDLADVREELGHQQGVAGVVLDEQDADVTGLVTAGTPVAEVAGMCRRSSRLGCARAY
ncbi:hypothetical protein ACFQV8_24865 [Pseudonocardia benzenivorans]